MKKHMATGREVYGVGVVIDNRDPERRGRIRVSLRTAANSVSAWLPILRRGCGKGHGLWALPAMGVQAAYVLTDAERGEGYVLGFIYDAQHRPPDMDGGKPTERTVFLSRSHRIEIKDDGGSEEIRLESADGRMRAVIGKDGGISLANELGGISIKCRNLRAEGGGGLAVGAGGTSVLATDGAAVLKTDGAVSMESGSELKVSGKGISLRGSRGVSAEGRQLAAEGDRVLGFDVHVMVVPSGTGTANVPLPHPFMGKLKDKLAKDVKLGNRKCAVKGSVARHDDATHMQLLGTIKFQKNPQKEGEVTGGTSAKVKIGGNEAAVMGSTVTTCNDVGARDNSTIIAAGASMPMPAIINPLNAEEWRREREEAEGKEPQFSSAKWSRTAVDEGEEAEFTATVKDIADGNAVTLQVFPEGKGPEDGAAYASIPVTVRDGAVSAKWSYRADRRELPPEQNPRFIFTAHSAWCNFAKSGNALEVRLRRPEIARAEWRDKDGNATGKGLVGEPLKLHAEVRDFEEGQGVTLTVRDKQTGEEVFQTGAEVRDGIAEAEWTYHYNGEKLDAKPRYVFEVTGNRCRKARSSEIEIGQKLIIKLLKIDNIEKLKADLYRYGADKTEEISFNSDNEYEKENLVPGKYSIKLKKE